MKYKIIMQSAVLYIGLLHVNIFGADRASQSAFNETLTVEPTLFVQLSFPYNLNAEYVSFVTTGTGAATQVNNFATLSSGTSASSRVTMYSNPRLKYQPSQGCAVYFTAIFSTGVAGTLQIIGAGNESAVGGDSVQDGFFFGYNGTSFGIVHYKSGSPTWIPQTSWNGDVMDGTGSSGMVLNPQAGNVYKIQYQWLGFGVIRFFIEDNDTGQLVQVHTIQYPNTYVQTSLFNPALRLWATVDNGITMSNITLQNPSFAGSIEGKLNADFDVRNSVHANNGNVGTSFESVVILRNMSTYAGKVNHILAYLDQMSMTCTTNDNIIYTIVLNPSWVSGSPTYTSGALVDSIIEYDNSSALLYVSGSGKQLLTLYLVDGQEQGVNLTQHDLRLLPGDVLAVIARKVAGGGTGDVYNSVSWIERF